MNNSEMYMNNIMQCIGDFKLPCIVHVTCESTKVSTILHTCLWQRALPWGYPPGTEASLTQETLRSWTLTPPHPRWRIGPYQPRWSSSWSEKIYQKITHLSLSLSGQWTKVDYTFVVNLFTEKQNLFNFQQKSTWPLWSNDPSCFCSHCLSTELLCLPHCDSRYCHLQYIQLVYQWLVVVAMALEWGAFIEGL